jgi:hypothetical protein
MLLSSNIGFLTKCCLLYPTVGRIWLYQPSSSVHCTALHCGHRSPDALVYVDAVHYAPHRLVDVQVIV